MKTDASIGEDSISRPGPDYAGHPGFDQAPEALRDPSDGRGGLLTEPPPETTVTGRWITSSGETAPAMVRRWARH